MKITPTSGLAQFVGQRVRISGFRYATIQRIHHGAEARPDSGLAGGVWGLMFEESRPGDRGGNTGFFFDYGTSFEIAPVR